MNEARCETGNNGGPEAEHGLHLWVDPKGAHRATKRGYVYFVLPIVKRVPSAKSERPFPLEAGQEHGTHIAGSIDVTVHMCVAVLADSHRVN